MSKDTATNTEPAVAPVLAESEGQAAKGRKPRVKDEEVEIFTFRTYEAEPNLVDLAEVRGYRIQGGRTEWQVDAATAARFRRHHHVITGRVIEV